MRREHRKSWVKRAVGAALAIALLLIAATSADAQQSDQDNPNNRCFRCHDDKDLTGFRGDEEIPMFVLPDDYAASVHGAMPCVNCHRDLEGETRRRHPEDLEPVDCGACHAAEQAEHAASLHGVAAANGDPMAPHCSDCHTKHDIRRSTDPLSSTAVMNVPLTCGRCHREGSPVSRTHQISQDHILENYSMSIHGEGLYRQGLTVTAVCTSCHTAHNILPHTDPRSSINVNNVAKTCSACHGQIEQVHRKVIEGRLWLEEPHKIPACVDCHAPHSVRNVFYPDGLADKDCLTCHSQPDLTMIRDGQTISLFIDEAAYEASAHRDTACAQCHSDVTVAQERACATVTGPVDCSVCHAEQVTEFDTTMHGTLHAQGDPDAPSCQDCHAKHATMPKDDPLSPTFARNVPTLCGRCHRAGEVAALRIDADVPDIFASYVDSIHGRGLLQSGLVVTATCADCHGAHSELPPEDPRSMVNHANIASTCGACHSGIEAALHTSIHWPTGTESDAGKDFPTCNDCHASHTIARISDPGSRDQMSHQCGRCHESETKTFLDTFHGKVSRLGGERAAKCQDCHGTHDILPPSEPGSTLSRENVVQTCGKCHEGSHRRFAGYLTHATHHDSSRYPWLFWTFWGMTALLVGTLSFALLHTLAWLIRLLLNREEWRAHKERVRTDHKKMYLRFNRKQRTMHIVMMISFFTLALTGMALKFSYMGWAQAVSRALGGFESMGILHRMGAIVLIGVTATHIWDVLRIKREEKVTWLQLITGPNSIIFNRRDISDFVQSMKWFFGIGPRPSYARYTYWEKFDYFAVFWGVMIIGSTGLLLWFPEMFTYVLPGWSVNVATIIHSDEALLAVGFIFTIHFFNTHFRPDKFPMDPVIFTGRMTVDELKYDKPDEYAALVASGRLDEHLVEPFQPSIERGLKAFGALALSIGLILLVLIVYTMLFGYR